MKNKKVLIIIGVITLIVVCILVLIGLVALTINTVNPSGALKDARNTQRQTDIDHIASGLKIFILDNDDYGFLSNIEDCEEGSSVIGTDGIDLGKKLLPDYIIAMPKDPKDRSESNTGYTICGAEEGVLKISAPLAEDKEISVEVSLKEIFQKKLNNLNPLDNPADSGDAKRTSDVTQILNAVTQFIAEGNALSDLGNITICNTGKAKIGTDGVDLAAKLVPTFLSAIPTDPSTGTQADTGYTICKNNKGQISVEAPDAEGSKKIQVLR